jgi:tetratricopeptide (TPR) repeat protein
LPSAPSVAAQPATVQAEEPAAPTLAKVEEPTADTDKAKAEAPVAAAPAAPAADNDARSRCRQSIRERRARDIVTVCSAAFEQDSADVDAAVAVAKVEFDRGRTAQAYTWSKKAIAVNPATADAYVFAGSVEQSQGHGKAAKEAYQHYLRLAPSGRYAAEIRTIVNSL